MADQNCSLCGRVAQLLYPGGYGGIFRKHIRCESCGEYFISLEGEAQISNPNFDPKFDPRQRALLSGVTREQSERGNPITICSSAYASAPDKIGISLAEILDTWAPHSIPDRVDRALQNLARKSCHPGDRLKVDVDKDQPLFFAENSEALRSILKHMVQAGLLDEMVSCDQGGGQYALTVKGWERVEELRRLRPESRQGFVAMWFDEQLKDAYENGLKSAIEDAGYDPIRVDMAQFNERIDDRIIAEIRRSRFLVADVTGRRPAVYFEAGFAMGLGLPIIFTCRKGHLDECSFDTRQYPHIEWESPDDLREKLKNRIEATIV